MYLYVGRGGEGGALKNSSELVGGGLKDSFVFKGEDRIFLR